MRVAANDLMQNFRYHVTGVLEGSKDNPIGYSPDDSDVEAGFQSVTLPEITAESVEYREGTMMWTQKYQGPPTVSDLTLSRGIAKNDTAFYDWMIDALAGRNYRASITIYHYQRTEYEPSVGGGATTSARKYECFQCLPIRVKPAADLESATGEVGLAEVDIALEYFTIDKGVEHKAKGPGVDTVPIDSQ